MADVKATTEQEKQQRSYQPDGIKSTVDAYKRIMGDGAADQQDKGSYQPDGGQSTVDAYQRLMRSKTEQPEKHYSTSQAYYEQKGQETGALH